MNKKILQLYILILLVGILLTSNINANSFEILTNKNDQIYNDSTFEKSIINNGIIFGRTIMTIKSNPCGPLQFCNISIEGEVTKNKKSGVFGFFIVRVPIGHYYLLASKFGFHSSFAYVKLFRFKPFSIVTFKLEKKGWN